MRAVGNYQLESELGRGGFGVVYRATDQVIGRDVAIKSLPLTGLGSSEETAEIRESLLREARAAGKLYHQNIVTVFHVIADPDAVFIVMELVEGQTLDRALASDYSEARVVSLLMQAAAALDYAHSQGIVHRDVKPSNFLVRPDGFLKLTDFGIAKINTATGASTRTLTGTPHYMSPEQALGRHLDGRSDQFSLAVMAWALLTGSQPFAGDTAMSVMYNIVNSPPSPEGGIRALPRALQAILERALSKDPSGRFASCGAFVSALREEADPSTLVLTAPQLRKRRGHLLWLAPLLAATILALVIWMGRGAKPLSTTPPTEPAKQQAVDRDPPAPAPQRPETGHPRVASPRKPPLSKQDPAAIASTLREPVPSPASETANQPAIGPATGYFVWDGKLAKGETLRIDGANASNGMAHGVLPGVPVLVEVMPDFVKVAQQPGPEGAWKTVILRNDGAPVDELRIRWTRK